MNESVCKCGKRIVWGVTTDGKKIPLDPSAPVYDIIVKENVRKGKKKEPRFGNMNLRNEHRAELQGEPDPNNPRFLPGDDGPTEEKP